MPTVGQIVVKQDKYLTSVVDAFNDALEPVLDKAQTKTLRELERKLTFVDGDVALTPANQQVLRSIDRIFGRQMKAAGYNNVVDAFSSQFADHLPLFQDVLDEIVDTSDETLPDIKFTSEDLDLFASKAIDAKVQLLDVVKNASSAAKRQALFNAGGLGMADLTDAIAKQFRKTASEAKGLADTAVSVYYRTVSDAGYQKIEAGLADGAVKYTYAGPVDRLERPFCANLSKLAKSYTREQIDDMDNEQIADVFTSCGGYCCRHQWILSLA